VSVEIDRLEIDKVAGAFVQARRDAKGLTAYPGNRPQDMAQAYAIQNHALTLEDRSAVGWKVGRVPPPHVERLGTDRLAGPIFADTVVWAAPGTAPDMPVFAEGFAAVEAEFMAHVAPGFTGPVPTDDAGTLAILDDLRIGIEIASSPYPGINEDGPTVTVSDFGNNHGLILGGAGRLARGRSAQHPLALTIDGAVAGEATAATMLDGPLGAVRFLLANLIERGLDTSKASGSRPGR
jgi:2-keto-4-pentenoate hydratase